MSSPDKRRAASQVQLENQDGVGHTPYPSRYTAARASSQNMATSPSVEAASDPWGSPVILNNELDHSLHPGSGFSPHFQQRNSLSETFGAVGLPSQLAHLPSMRRINPDPDPLMRFCEDTAAPWNPQQVSVPLTQGHVEMASAYTFASPGNTNFRYYRSSPRSGENSSRVASQHVDSGYETRSAISDPPHSLGHTGPSDDCPDVNDEVQRFHLYPGNQPYDTPLVFPQDQYAQPTSDNSPEIGSNYPRRCDYQGCPKDLKNLSEYKKHMSQHTRPHKCPACTKEFSTNNDLERHKKSVHKMAPASSTDKSYRCAAPNCSKRDKLWPRLDNFRQHCGRIHKDQNIEELVRKSETGSHIPSHTSGPVTPSAGHAGSQHWSPGSGYSGSSSYTNLPRLNLSHDQRDPNLQGADRPPAFHIASPSVSSSQDESPFHYVSGLTASGTRVTPSDMRGIPYSPSNVSRPSSQSGLYQRRNYERPELTTDKPQRPEISQATFETDMIDSRNRRSASLKGQPSSKNQSTLLDSKAQELSQVLIQGYDKNEMKREDFESTIKDRVKDIIGPGGECKLDVSPMESGVGKRYKCDQCSKTVKRHCDLKKHKKRHTRPYGCTYTACLKRFGSKNDWKRHENTRHYQIEAWRCQEHSVTSKIHQCAKVFYRREQYQSHLKDHHHFTNDAEIRKQSQRNRIGRNGQSGFWCGFCCQIVTLAGKGLDAWDQRFDHIDRKHFNVGQTIDQWYPLDKDVPIEMLPSDSINGSPSPAADKDESEDEDSSDGADQDDSPVSQYEEGPQVLRSIPSKRTQDSTGDTERSSKRQAVKYSWFCVQGWAAKSDFVNILHQLFSTSM